MPFGKKSQEPVTRPYMVKTHAGLGNHKQKFTTHGAVHANASGLAKAPTIQPSNGNGSPKSAMN